MTKLLGLQEQLQDTNAAIAALQKEVAKNPSQPSLGAIRRSLEKRQNVLESDFLATAQTIGVDVCSYRSFDEKGTVKAAPAFASIAEFQNAFSVTYDAIKNGRKQTTKIGQQVAQETAFGFGYGFMGSVGFVLTLPNERLLVGETYLDSAMIDVFAMAKAQSPEAVLEFAKRLGVAPINAIYKWADVQTKHRLGADVDWRRGDSVKAKLFVQPQELDRLQDTIDRTSDEETAPVEIDGTLDDVAHSKHTFRMTVEGGEIHGQFGDAIDPQHTVEIPGLRYRATLEKTTKTVFSTGEVKVSYFLKKLTKLGIAF